MKQILWILIFLFNSSFWVLAQTEGKPCPIIDVSALFESVEVGDAAIFSVEVSKEIENYNVRYNWQVINGELLEGQGSKHIRVLKKNENSLGAVVQIEGLPKNCKNTDSATLPIIDYPPATVIDRYGKLNVAAEKARLDDFYIRVEINKNAEGYIIITGKSRLEIKRRLNFLHRYFNDGSKDKTLVSYAIGSEPEQVTHLFVVPPKVQLPICSNCLIIRAEDFEKLANLFQSTTTKKNKK